MWNFSPCCPLTGGLVASACSQQVWSPEPCTIYLVSPKLPQRDLCWFLWGAQDWQLCPGRKLDVCWPWSHYSERATRCFTVGSGGNMAQEAPQASVRPLQTGTRRHYLLRTCRLGAGAPRGPGEEAVALAGCARRLSCHSATILTEARLHAPRGQATSASPLVAVTGSSFLLLPKALPASGCSSKWTK